MEETVLRHKILKLVFVKLFALIFTVQVAVTGCGMQQKNAGPQDRTAENGSTNKNTTLHLYTALDSNEAKLYIDAFEKQTGIHVKWVRLSSGEVLTRLRSEKNNPQVSAWFGGPFTDYMTAKKEDLLSPYKPKADFILPKEGYDMENYWTGISFGVIGFASNKEILQRRKLSPPQSWDDLIKPEFVNDVSMAYAYTSGTAYTILATLVQLMGKEKALIYVKKLNKNIHHYNKSGSACVTQAALGEITVGVAFSQDILKKGISKGFPIVMTFPEEGTGYEYAAMALVNGAPEPELGRKFLDFMLSDAAQKIMIDSFRFSLNPTFAPASDDKSMSAYTLIPFDAEKASAEKKEIIEQWRGITAQ